MRTRVATISVEARVLGIRLFVQDATITLGINSIPTVELSCSPSDKGQHTPLKPNVEIPRIGTFADLYKRLAEAAEGRDERGEIKIKIEDDTGYSEEIELKEWILSGVGFSNVSASAAPYMSVIMQHPICKLTKFGSIYETPKRNYEKKMDKQVESCEDILEIIKNAYNYLKSADSSFWPNKECKFAKKFRTKLGEEEFQPHTYLEFGSNGGGGGGGRGGTEGGGGGGGNPGNKMFLLKGAERQLMAKAIGRMILPREGGSSTWDMLSSACGTMLLNIVQDEQHNFTEKKLVIEPIQPWKKDTVRLYDEECFWTEIPGMDPFRISGVMCRKLGPFSDFIGLGMTKNGNGSQEDPISEAMYFPESIKEDDADARIIKTSAPALLDSAFRRDAAYGTVIATANIKMAETIKNNYNKVLKKYCKALYEISAASRLQARAQMCLWFKDMDGNMILPGNTCKFISEGSPIYYGYIRQVVHHMSTSGGNSTTVTMSYVRPEANYKVHKKDAITMGSKNAAYE